MKNEMDMIYKIKTNNENEIIGRKFIEKNKGKFKLLINEKEINIKELSNINNFFQDGDYQKIKIIELEKITDLSNLFYKCESLIELTCDWDFSNIVNISNMFNGCKSLTKIGGIQKWDTSNITNISCLFYDCISLKSLPDISSWNTSNIINMLCLFTSC